MDKFFLNIAIEKAKENQGYSFPNPTVGAVIVKDGLVLSIGITGKGGSPHAEIAALKKLQKNEIIGAELFVSLEPCAHIGKNPSCAEIIAKSGIKRVVIGCIDENSLVRGKGGEILRNNNVEVTILNDKDSLELHSKFFFSLKNKRAFMTGKIACSIDGKIALSNGESKWISNEQSRKLVHLMRSRADAVFTTISVVKADNPNLDCRISGYSRNNNIVLYDPNLELDLQSNLVQNSERQKLFILTKSLDKKFANFKNIEIINFTHLDDALYKLYVSTGFINIFVEAGRFNLKLLNLGLLDELLVFRSNQILGSDGVDFSLPFNFNEIKDSYQLERVEIKEIGNNNFERYKCV